MKFNMIKFIDSNGGQRKNKSDINLFKPNNKKFKKKTIEIYHHDETRLNNKNSSISKLLSPSLQVLKYNTSKELPKNEKLIEENFSNYIITNKNSFSSKFLKELINSSKNSLIHRKNYETSVYETPKKTPLDIKAKNSFFHNPFLEFGNDNKQKKMQFRKNYIQLNILRLQRVGTTSQLSNFSNKSKNKFSLKKDSLNKFYSNKNWNLKTEFSFNKEFYNSTPLNSKLKRQSDNFPNLPFIFGRMCFSAQKGILFNQNSRFYQIHQMNSLSNSSHKENPPFKYNEKFLNKEIFKNKNNHMYNKNLLLESSKFKDKTIKKSNSDFKLHQNINSKINYFNPKDSRLIQSSEGIISPWSHDD